MSSLLEREPLKRNRDYDKAIAVARVAERYLNLPFDSEDLSALPIELRQQAARLLRGGISEPEFDEDAGEQPSWGECKSQSCDALTNGIRHMPGGIQPFAQSAVHQQEQLSANPRKVLNGKPR